MITGNRQLGRMYLHSFESGNAHACSNTCMAGAQARKKAHSHQDCESIALRLCYNDRRVPQMKLKQVAGALTCHGPAPAVFHHIVQVVPVQVGRPLNVIVLRTILRIRLSASLSPSNAQPGQNQLCLCSSPGRWLFMGLLLSPIVVAQLTANSTYSLMRCLSA